MSGETPAPPETVTTEQVVPVDYNGSAISLAFLFQMVTACAVFFAIYRVAPGIAICGTVVVAPAIIRSAIILDRFGRIGVTLSLGQKATLMGGSILVVLLTLSLAIGSFLAISLLFGVLGMLLSVAVGSGSLSNDAAVVGTAGGMIWGFAGAMIAIGYSFFRLWIPQELQE